MAIVDAKHVWANDNVATGIAAAYQRGAGPSRLPVRYSQRVSTTAAVPADVLEALELLFFGAIGITSFALAGAAASELTLSQWRALVVVGRTDGIRVGDVAARVGISMPAASRLLRRLERRGYVATARDESDRRATLVRLTVAGSRLRTAVIERRRALLNEALAAHASRLPKDLSGGLRVLGEAFDRYE